MPPEWRGTLIVCQWLCTSCLYGILKWNKMSQGEKRREGKSSLEKGKREWQSAGDSSNTKIRSGAVVNTAEALPQVRRTAEERQPQGANQSSSVLLALLEQDRVLDSPTPQKPYSHWFELESMRTIPNNQVVSGHPGRGQAQPASLLRPRAGGLVPTVPILEANQVVHGALRGHTFCGWTKLWCAEKPSYILVSNLPLGKSIICNCKQLLIALLIIKAKF